METTFSGKMSQRFKVFDTHQLSPGQKKLVKIQGKEIAIFNISGTFYAINNSCTHSTGPLVEGRLYKSVVTCPWHGAKFDITNGECLGGPANQNVTTYQVYVENNTVFIELT